MKHNLFDVGDVVYVVDRARSVKKGPVKRILVTLDEEGTRVLYEVVLPYWNNSTGKLEERVEDATEYNVYATPAEAFAQ